MVEFALAVPLGAKCAANEVLQMLTPEDGLNKKQALAFLQPTGLVWRETARVAKMTFLAILQTA